MSYDSILAAIDKELARLHGVRGVLVQKAKATKSTQKGGRAATAAKKSKRRLSPEARARIAEAQRKRWAAARKASKR